MKIIKCDNNILQFDEIGAKLLLWERNNINIVEKFGDKFEKFGFLSFPFIGFNKYKFLLLKNDKIETRENGNTFDKKFKVVNYTKNKIVFELDYGLIEEKIPILINITYQIFLNKLVVSIKLINNSNQKAYYKIGWCNNYKLWSDFKTYHLECEANEYFTLNANKLLSNKKQKIDTNLSNNLENKEWMVFEGSTVKLFNPNNKIIIKTQSLPFFGISKKKKNESIFIGKWSHLPNFLDETNEFKKNFKNSFLNPKENKKFKIEMEII